MDIMDEFEEYKAMAYNNNRRGSQSVPCTPQFVKRHIFNRESSKSEKRRSSSKKKKDHSTSVMSTGSNGLLSSSYMDSETNESEVINDELATRLSKMTLVEIWQKRQRLQRQSSLGDPDYSPHSHDHSPPVHSTDFVLQQQRTHLVHSPLGARHSDPDNNNYRNSGSSSLGHFSSKHGRSFSCRDRTRNRRFKEIDLEPMRPRTSSVPSKAHIRRPDTLALKNHIGEMSPREETSEFYLVRTFSTSKKGLINRGDSFKRRKTPMASNGYLNGQDDFINEPHRITENLSHASSACSLESCSDPPIHTVLMLGSHGVGKTSLLQQFTSSDYIANLQRDSFQEQVPQSGNFTQPFEEDLETKLVSVLLDGEESTIYIATSTKLEVQNTFQNPDACLIVYSVSEQSTFEKAEDLLHDLRHSQHGFLIPVILVANKGDMVRNRVVHQNDGKAMAVNYNCKYIEVSAVMNLKVDELLAGVVKQIRLTTKRHNSKRRKLKACIPDENAGNGCIEYAARGIVGKILRKSSPMFRSCDNLLVL